MPIRIRYHLRWLHSVPVGPENTGHTDGFARPDFCGGRHDVVGGVHQLPPLCRPIDTGDFQTIVKFIHFYIYTQDVTVRNVR